MVRQGRDHGAAPRRHIGIYGVGDCIGSTFIEWHRWNHRLLGTQINRRAIHYRRYSALAQVFLATRPRRPAADWVERSSQECPARPAMDQSAWEGSGLTRGESPRTRWPNAGRA